MVRIPSQENRNKRRLVPGRPSVYIIPSSDCVDGINGDSAFYLSNTKILRVLILKPVEEGSDLLLSAIRKGSSELVTLTSARDEYGGMTDVALAVVSAEALRVADQLDGADTFPNEPWRWNVRATTASIAASPSDAGLSEYLDRHNQVYNPSKELFPENVARFSRDEMAAALHSIRQQELRRNTLCFLYTSAEKAAEMSTDGGIPESSVVTTQSPVDFGWEQNAGGRFKSNASKALGLVADSISAVLVLGVPKKVIVQAQTSTRFSIPRELLVSASTGEGDYVYANAHIHKSYMLVPRERPSVVDKDSVGV